MCERLAHKNYLLAKQFRSAAVRDQELVPSTEDQASIIRSVLSVVDWFAENPGDEEIYLVGEVDVGYAWLSRQWGSAGMSVSVRGLQ